MRLCYWFSAIIASAFSISAPAAAQSSNWEFQISPYIWMSGLDGTVGTFPGLPAADVDLSFSDILDDLDFGGMVFFSARSAPWVIYADAMYTKISSKEALGGVIFNSVEIESETTTFAIAAGRTIAETPTGYLDAYVGARAWWLDNSFSFNAVGGGATGRQESASWVDPIIGLAGNMRVSDRWSVFGAIEIGGFGVNSADEWSIWAGAAYQISDKWAASFGWRHLEVDYDDDGVVFDVSQSGPLLGMTYKF